MCFVLLLVPVCTLWFSGTALLLCSVSRQCVAVFFFALLLFPVGRLSHYSPGFLCLFATPIRYAYCNIYSMCNVVALINNLYCCHRCTVLLFCVGSCLAGKVAVVMSWGGSVFTTWFGRVLVGAGWNGLFMAGGVLVRHRKFCWGLC